MSLDPRVKLRFELPRGGGGRLRLPPGVGRQSGVRAQTRNSTKKSSISCEGRRPWDLPEHVRGRGLLPSVASFHFFSSAGLGQEGRPRARWSLVGRAPGQESSVRDTLPFYSPILTHRPRSRAAGDRAVPFSGLHPLSRAGINCG